MIHTKGGTMFERHAPRTSQILVRLTDVERGLVVEKKGEQSFSDYVRELIRKDLATKKKRRAR
jgi:predicted CopG family antitoxin